MTQRPASGSPLSPRDVSPDQGRPHRLQIAGAVGAAAALAIVVGLATIASTAPPSSEDQPAVAVTASEPPALPDEPSPSAGNVIEGEANKEPQALPSEGPGPGAPETPAAPVAELKRASADFETAAGNVSAPATAVDPDAPGRAMPDFSEVARGVALGELQARFEEFQHNDWVQTGSVNVISTKPGEEVLVDGVAAQRISSCIDSSAVEIRDTSGAVVLAAVPAGARTAMNIYDIQQHDGKWVVVSHSFPDVAAC